jgi:sulfite oxidase
MSALKLTHACFAAHFVKRRQSVEPFWHIYRQHYASDLPMKLMEHMVIGTLREEDQDAIDEQMQVVMQNDPYAREPVRHKSLKVHGDTPMNAESPGHLLTESYLTPPSLFYIRHHHPVPILSPKEVQEYKLTFDLTAYGKGTFEVTLEDLKKLPKTEITSTLQCSGNRRSGFNSHMRTSGTPWGQGKMSKALCMFVCLIVVHADHTSLASIRLAR